MYSSSYLSGDDLYNWFVVLKGFENKVFKPNGSPSFYQTRDVFLAAMALTIVVAEAERSTGG